MFLSAQVIRHRIIRKTAFTLLSCFVHAPATPPSSIESELVDVKTTPRSWELEVTHSCSAS
eukprot:2457978-Rhodomonas_salina.1